VIGRVGAGDSTKTTLLDALGLVSSVSGTVGLRVRIERPLNRQSTNDSTGGA